MDERQVQWPQISVKPAVLGCGGAILAALALRGWLIVQGVVPFNADEAVVALMARHILKGDLPVFFYGQAYMGSLDAILAALGFAAFGESVAVIRWIQAGLFTLTLVSTAALVYLARGDWPSIVAAVWLLAVPAVNVTLYTTASIGNYGETLLLGNLQLILTLRIANTGSQESTWMPGMNAEGSQRPGKRNRVAALWFAWGLVAGLGLWSFGLSLVYTIPCAVYLLYVYWKMIRRARSTHREGDSARPGIHSGRRGYLPSYVLLPAFSLLGTALGSAPWWYYAGRHGLGALVTELAGGAIAGVGGGSWLETLAAHSLNFVVFGVTAILGMRPPWEIRWLALPLLPLAAGFWLGLAAFVLYRFRKRRWALQPLSILLAAVTLTLIAGFILSPFGADPSGRYFLPLGVVLAILGGQWTGNLYRRHGSLAYLAPAVVVLFHLVGTLETASRFPPGITTQFDAVAQIDHTYDQALIEFLHSQEATRGYTNYWVAYPLAFLSEEKLIFVPRLPYHQDFRYTARDDRYAPYRQAVARSERTAFITTHHPALDDRLRESFVESNIEWEETQIGDFRVFFNLTEKVTPAALDAWLP